MEKWWESDGKGGFPGLQKPWKKFDYFGGIECDELSIWYSNIVAGLCGGEMCEFFQLFLEGYKTDIWSTVELIKKKRKNAIN